MTVKVSYISCIQHQISQLLLAVCDCLGNCMFSTKTLLSEWYGVHTIVKIHAKQFASKPPELIEHWYVEIVKLEMSQ